jgi:hypothetical protein
MEEMNDQAPNMSPVEPEEEAELNHTDKLVGVFSEPGNTFTKMSKTGAKTSDWLIPILILFAVAILASIVTITNPTLSSKMKQDNEKRIQELVDKGTITQEQADQQIEMSERFMGGTFMIITSAISILIMGFIFFFILSALWLLAIKLILKGEGTFKDVLSAYGLPQYILVIQAIVMLILSLVLGTSFRSTSIAAFMDLDKASILNFLLSKIDIFSIWFYAVLSIGFAKMFKSNDTGKYYAVVFGLWILVSLIIFFIAKAVPFLSFLNG